jgi:hypothetical protein
MSASQIKLIRYFFTLSLFIFIFIISNFNSDTLSNLIINTVFGDQISLIKNIIIILPTIFIFLNLKLFLNKKFLLLLSIFSPLVLFGFVGIVNYLTIVSLIIFSTCVNIIFNKKKLLNILIIEMLKKLLFFLYFLILIFFVYNFFFNLDNLNYLYEIKNSFVDDKYSGLTSNINFSIIFKFQSLFKYSKYLDNVILFIIFFIYVGKPENFLKKNLFLILLTLIFLIFQGNDISVLIILSLIFFSQFKKYLQLNKILKIIFLIILLIISIDILYFYNNNIQTQKNKYYNLTNSNFTKTQYTNEIFNKTLILRFLDIKSSFRIQKIFAPCDFLKRNYNAFPKIDKNNITFLSYQYRCHYYNDNVKLVSNNFLNFRIDPNFNAGSIGDKLIRFYHLDSGIFEILYKYGILFFLFVVSLNLFIIFLTFKSNYHYGIIMLILFGYFIVESGLYSTGNIFSIIYNFIFTKTFFMTNFKYINNKLSNVKKILS